MPSRGTDTARVVHWLTVIFLFTIADLFKSLLSEDLLFVIIVLTRWHLLNSFFKLLAPWEALYMILIPVTAERFGAWV